MQDIPSVTTNAQSLEDRLLKLRNQIDTVDKKILACINERAKIVQEVGKAKEDHESEVYIPSREKSILKKLCGLNNGPLPSEAIESIFREIISACRALESKLRICFMGQEGSYHHAVAQSRFGRSAAYIPVPTISAVFDEVEHKRADFGVVAIENSIEGSLGETLDRLAQSPVKIMGESYLPVSHNLISQSELHEINRVYSHPQALAQCRKWLSSNLPNVEIIGTTSTTQGVTNCKTDPNAAAIASRWAAELMEMDIQVSGIEDYAGNTTRFLVIGQNDSPVTGDDKTSMIVFIRDKAGGLYLMLEPFNRYEINITNIVSRPVKEEAWQYMFFLEVQGHHQEENVKHALEAIEKNSLHIKLLGSYPRAHFTTQNNKNE